MMGGEYSQNRLRCELSGVAARYLATKPTIHVLFEANIVFVFVQCQDMYNI